MSFLFAYDVLICFYRVFHLRLKRDTSVFSDGLQVEDHEGRRLQVDTDHLYSGEIVGERDSHVFGSIHDGIFQVNRKVYSKIANR